MAVYKVHWELGSQTQWVKTNNEYSGIIPWEPTGEVRLVKMLIVEREVQEVLVKVIYQKVALGHKWDGPSMKNKWAARYCLWSVKSLIMRFTLCVVGIRRYMASNSGWGSRLLEIDSITGVVDMNQVCLCRWFSYIQVTLSSRTSNCFKTAPRSFWEKSSTTSIFHRVGGLTDRMASKNSMLWYILWSIERRRLLSDLLLRKMVINEAI